MNTKVINVALNDNPYKIVIGKNILGGLGKYLNSLSIGKDALVVTSVNIKRLHGKTLFDGLKKYGYSVTFFIVPDGEKSKSSNEAIKLIEKIARYDVLKRPFIIAFGGGVIGDLAGFVAAVYKRGIPLVQVPTTLLAQIDSAIGGKTAIDLSVGKNLMGAYYQPKVVWSDIAVLETLPIRQIRNAFAEAVKYGVIYDYKLFSYIESNYKNIFKFDHKALMKLVYDCSRIKAEVIMADEKETKNIRVILNFGHTLGHAIEAAGKFTAYDHGMAIALGMRIASFISCSLKLFSKDDDERLNSLLSAIGLPKKIEKVSIKEVFKLMHHDKKFISGKNRFVLAQQIGKVKIVENIPTSLIKESIERFR